MYVCNTEFVVIVLLVTVLFLYSINILIYCHFHVDHSRLVF